MLLRWHGHACFEIVHGGKSLVFDPHDGDYIGLPRPKASANVVLVSHEHRDHNASEVVAGRGAEIVKGEGERRSGPFSITGFASVHDEDGGAKRGMNTIFAVEVGGVRLAHMGDLGIEPGDEVARALRGIDILMIPIGGTFTVDPEGASKVVKDLAPRTVVPMHYRVAGLRFQLSPVEPFLALMGGRRVSKVGNSVEVLAGDIPDKTVWVFSR